MTFKMVQELVTSANKGITAFPSARVNADLLSGLLCLIFSQQLGERIRNGHVMVLIL